MRIVHLTASSFFGGPERQMLGLATALPNDYTSTFLSFSEQGRCRSFLDTVIAAGFDAIELTHDSPQLRSSVREIAAILRDNHADVLITHGYKSNVLGRPAARRAGIPIVSVSRGWTGESLKVKCYDSLDRFHLRFMDRVVCVSAGQADKVRRAGVLDEKVRVVRNGARLDAFATPSPTGRSRLRGLANGPGPIVFAAGRLSPEKGFAVLVEAASTVLAAIPNVRFVLFGDGPVRERLERQIEMAGVASAFHMHGFRDDLDELLPWADVVVLPSFTEGLPNVALEAGAAGVPVVATSVGGTPEVVVHGQTGFLVSPGDPAALADRIIELLKDSVRARAFGQAGRQRMHEFFSFEGQALAYRSLFAELIPNRRLHAVGRETACA
jgi:glycosyltransferase involved in cell wall biosynthesis